MTGIAKKVSLLSNTDVHAAVGKRERHSSTFTAPMPKSSQTKHRKHNTTARYIISVRRSTAQQDYEWVQELMDENPELIPTIVGIDFADIEEGYPPKDNRALFQRVHKDNQEHPERALEITYHVGESYFDKSLESAIRWCHEVAEMDARRLGHAIALGLDPAVAIARRPDAHAKERVSERLDQIAYDLTHASELSAFDIESERQRTPNRTAKPEKSSTRRNSRAPL